MTDSELDDVLKESNASSSSDLPPRDDQGRSKSKRIALVGLLALVSVFFVVGRQAAQRFVEPSMDRRAPVAAVNATPMNPHSISDPPLLSQTLERPVEHPEDKLPAQPQKAPPQAKSFDPQRTAVRRPPRIARRKTPPAPPSQPSEPPPRSTSKPASVSPPPPSFIPPEPDYPTAKPRPVPQATNPGVAPHDKDRPFEMVIANSGLRPSDSPPGGELFMLSGDEEAARPIHHPAVVVDGWSDRQFLTVQFAIQPNGRFVVNILKGTGDPVKDALALNTLRQWRWKPKTVKRRPVASVEVLRLKRNLK